MAVVQTAAMSPWLLAISWHPRLPIKSPRHLEAERGRPCPFFCPLTSPILSLQRMNQQDTVPDRPRGLLPATHHDENNTGEITNLRGIQQRWWGLAVTSSSWCRPWWRPPGTASWSGSAYTSTSVRWSGGVVILERNVNLKRWWLSESEWLRLWTMMNGNKVTSDNGW